MLPLMKHTIYFDHAATTAVDPRVFTVMKPYFIEQYGNPSSVYGLGQKARQAIEESRKICAEILECPAREIIFTSGGTESNNLFIFGVAQAYPKLGKHIITTKIEHESVLKPLKVLEKQGFEVTYLDVGKNGIVSAESVKKALRPDTIFITIIYANNEIGTIQPIPEIGRIIKKYKKNSLPYFHTDACQASAYLNLSVKRLGVDAMTLNGGKIYGPKGSGILYLNKSIQPIAQIVGGSQERKLRAGTENVPAIVGFGEALKLAQTDYKTESRRLLPLRNKLIKGILSKIPDSHLNGDISMRLPNNVNIAFKGVDSNSLLIRLDMLGIAASAGSACNSGYIEPPHVLQAISLPPEWICGTIRFTLGHGNTQKEIDYLLKVLPPIIKELRKISPFA